MPESSPFSQSLGNQQHEILLRAKPEDFDGHSEFHRLTPEQRLAWLDQAVAFIQATIKPPANLPQCFPLTSQVETRRGLRPPCHQRPPSPTSLAIAEEIAGRIGLN